ncbi:hypothetical protein scyTo_0003439 [Scyliorhinus torazame]|uniref:Mesothelin-like protein n=1 Tax=Scyliorhinus torazame TaxID=75743 RepID=A0A401PMK1_SCYTO|nr:hypothetical protein [Scyliorhinus torazame]
MERHCCGQQGSHLAAHLTDLCCCMVFILLKQLSLYRATGLLHGMGLRAESTILAVIEGIEVEFSKSLAGVSDIDVDEWLNVIFIPSLPLVTTTILASNNSRRFPCPLLKKIVTVLSSIKQRLEINDQRVISKNLLTYGKAFPLHCYGNNSFIFYVMTYFQNYSEFLTLKDVFSLIPMNRTTEVLNSIDPRELANVLRKPRFIDDNQILTIILLNIKPNQNLATFIGAFNNTIQDSNLSAAILEGLWPRFTEDLPDLSDKEVDEWLSVRLAPYLPFISTHLLVSNSTLRVPCLVYRKIVDTLNVLYRKLNAEKRSEIYKGIRAYLQQGPKPKCYNASDPVLNSTAWFTQYIGLYLSQMSLTDLQSFFNNETLLREFAADGENLALLENLALMNEVSRVYINFLVEHNPNFNATSLPNSLVCFITETNLLQSLTEQQVLAVTWIPRQAAVFFESVVRNSNNFSRFSPSVLQGFSCGAVKDLEFSTFLQLLQAMKGKGAVFDESQLSCMSARLSANGTSLAIETFPVDVLLFLNSAQFRRSSNCREFFKLVGKSNINVLRKWSARRRNLLNDARICLIYPNGLPEKQIRLLGNISTVFNASDVSSWNITQVDTLAALMAQHLENTTVQSIVTRFLQLGGILNAVSLKAIGGAKLCTLDELQLSTISNLTDAGALDLSMCTQSKKNLLYRQARNELNSQQSNPIPYFQLIKAYVGGTPVDDLTSLANNRVNMDFETFKGLNPEEVKKLSPQNLIDLLGFNLQALQHGVNETVVVIWVASHTESEVRRLGLTGGIPDNSSEPQPDDRPGNTTVNETTLCKAVNSSALNNFLNNVNVTQLCNFNIKEYACAKTDLLLSGISSDALTDVFQCFIDLKPLKKSDETALTIFVRKLDRTKLNEALDKFNNKTLNPSIPLMTKITFMNALWEIVKTNENLTNAGFLRKWFQERFRPFVAGISQSVLSRLLARNITCDGYQEVTKGLNNGFNKMTEGTRKTVVRVWIFGYLNTTGAGCISNTNGSRDWLLVNWAMFSQLVQIEDLTRLNSNFNALDAAELLTPSQLGEFAGKTGAVTNADDVQKLFNSITSASVTQFIETFRTAASQNNVVFAPGVRTALLQEVLNRTQPILLNASNTELQIWFSTRLKVLLTGLTENMVPLIFVSESCNGSRIIVSTLSLIKQQLTSSVQEAIYRNILTYTKEIPLRCYENNSFSLYLESQFENFSEFLTLSDVSSFVPSNRAAEVFNTADPIDFADLFSRPRFIDDNNILTMVLMNYQPIQNLGTFVDQFNQKTRDDNLTDAKQTGIMKGLWPQFVNSLFVLNDTEQDEWLNARLSPYLSFITTDLLASNNTLRVQCLPYRNIVRTLSAHYAGFTSDKQKEIYNGINVYLQQEPKPKCYNVNDPDLNSTAWFAQYLGLFMNNVTAADLQSFARNKSILQDFAANRENQLLVANLTLPTEISKLYVNILVNNNPNVDILSIPGSLICFTADTAAFQSLNGQKTLTVIERINQVCEFSPTSNATSDALSQITDEQIKLSKSLVSKIDNFSVSTLNNLEQTAFGMSVSQIEETAPNNFKGALTSLSNVRGWKLGQTRNIVSKLSRSGLEFNNKNTLIRLGTLVPGVPSYIFQSTEPTVLADVTSNPIFVRNILEAPQPTQQIIVLKVLQTETDPLRRVRKIPNKLVKEIPSALLTSDLNLNDVNNKPWTPSQAAVFFESIVTKNKDYKTFSPTVLQGFSCGAVKDLTSAEFLQLVRSMKGKGAVLDASQLNCMSYKLTSTGTPSTIDTFPEDLLLFFNSNKFRRSPNCKAFFKAVGKSNLNILRKGSKRRQKLLNDAFTCLGITGGRLTKESITVLGGLTCDLEGSIISNCDISILDQLKNCISYSEDQMAAIQPLLYNRNNKFGLPGTWTSRTVSELGNLPLALSSIWEDVNQDAYNAAIPKVIRKMKKFSKRKVVRRFIKQLRRQRRLRRAAGCTVGQITSEVINELIPVNYDAAQLEACLDNATLKDNMELLGTLDFDSDQLQVLKNKLNQIYPNGLPENQIELLGDISTVFNATEVSSWNITQIETLAALVMQQLENATVKSIITRYLQLGGTLDAVSVKAIGGPNLCTLDESQLMTILNLTNAGVLDISTCTQSKKNWLYTQALSELISQQNNTIAYFNLIKPYLDGAKAGDLDVLANNKVNMDFATFIKLNPEEITNISAKQLQDLLGINLPALQTGANETVVLSWVRSHFESEVRSVGLSGGIPDPSSDPQLNLMCGNTTFNETASCAAGNSSALNSFLMSVNQSQLCNFNITDYACAQRNLLLTGLTSNHLASVFNCFTTAKALNKPDGTALGVFIQKLDKTILNEALDKFNNMTLSTSSIPLMTKITFMNALWEIVKTNENLTNSAFLTKWFQERVRPFIAGISESVLSCLQIRNTTCEGYQAVIKGLNNEFKQMSQATRETVLQIWILTYLNTTGAGCISNINGSRDWLLMNWGMFSQLVQIKDLARLNLNFNGIEVVDLLTVRQLAQLSAITGTLKNSDDVRKVMSNITLDKITQFTDIFSFEAKQNNVTLLPEVRFTLLTEVLNRAEPIISSSNETELQTWLGTRLQLLIPGLNGNLTELILTNVSCNGARIIIQTLNARFFEFTTNVQQQMYKSIRTYLRKGPKPRCYNARDPALNSTAWFANYLGKFLIYTSTDDLTMLTNNATLQIFAANQDNINLLKSLKLPEDIQRLYASALFKNTAVNVSSIPDSLVCFIVGTSTVQSLTAQQAITLLKKANKACQTPSTNGTAPTDEQMQLAVALVSKITNFSSDTLTNLGQSAAGLSTTQISKIGGSNIFNSLGSLRQVNGWTYGKANALIKKLTSTGINFQVNNATNLLNLGTLVVGLSNDEIKNINSSVIAIVATDTTFVENVLLAPEPVKVLVVQKIIESSNDPITAIQIVPSKLATKIPLPRLISRNINLNLVNNKQWIPEQAAVFFGTLTGNSTINFDDVSTSVLQGFSCAAGKNLNSEQFQKFVKATKGKTSLSHDQLICMARRLNPNGTPGNISALPEDVLLFYDPETFSNETCTDFYRAVGHANLNILPQGSRRRRNLLENANKCLKLSNKNLSKRDVTILNNLICDYQGDITNADISILEALKDCTDFTPKQQNGINFQLNNKDDLPFGDPSTWTKSTLRNLDALVFAVNRSTWNKVSTDVILEGLRPYMRRQSRFQIQNQRNLLSRLFLTSRSKRATGCLIGQITADKSFDVMLPAQYGTAELDACLDNNVLMDQLSQLGNLAFSKEQLEVLKNKLNQSYAHGLPEEKVLSLGYIAAVYDSTEISNWNVTKLETISAVLPNSQNDNARKAIVSRYLDASGVLNADVLNVIGGSVLCLLDESQLQTISPADVSNATPLNISSCSQSKKNIIYTKAKSIIEKQNSESATYYSQIRTYLGGATTAHIQTLAFTNINMDPNVFLALNPEEVQVWRKKIFMHKIACACLRVHVLGMGAVVAAEEFALLQ